MSTFSTTEFKFKVDSDGYWPNPVRQDDGTVKYRADIIVEGLTNYTNLQNAVTRGTAKPVSGLRITNYHIEAGIGPRALTVPMHRGGTRTYEIAILTSLDIKGSGEAPNGKVTPVFAATAEWIIISTATPGD